MRERWRRPGPLDGAYPGEAAARRGKRQIFVVVLLLASTLSMGARRESTRWEALTMRWLRDRWAGWWGRSSKGPDASDAAGNRLSYNELIHAAAAEDPALDARLRQSVERIGHQDEEAED